ncbi:hypothetical protein L227DRAFT_467591, partial [Lentinus tigrinus ALCF2SS1-6]
GMPKVLTGDEFVAKVKEHEAAQASAATEKVERRLEREQRAKEMEEWKRQEAERKKKNTAITAHFEAAVEEW